MKAIYNKAIFAAILSAGLLTGCVNDDDYDTPQLECIETTLVKTMEPQQVPAPANATLFNGPEGSVIEAYVTSSDAGGNFFKTISFQTLDGSFGFSVPVDVTSTFVKFETGRKVLIKLDSTYTDKEFGSLRIGALYQGEVGRLSQEQYDEVLNRSCTYVSEEALVQKISIDQALSNARLNTLIELQNVQFADSAVGETYYDSSNDLGGATNYYLVDEAGNEIIFRTSSFANFAGSVVPEGSGTVRGVLTKFNDDFQFLARVEADVKLTNPRFGDDDGGGDTGSDTALGGTAITYTGSATENFESYALNANAFPKYVNDYTEGDRYWQIKQFPAGTGNKYIEMTSFNGSGNPGEPAKTYFFVPVDFSAANTFTFKKEIRYMTGEALKVYYVTAANYSPLGQVNAGSFVDITSEFTNLIYPAAGQSQNNFTTAGTYNIPAGLTGNGFFVFEYNGTETITTTIQLDDITIN